MLTIAPPPEPRACSVQELRALTTQGDAARDPYYLTCLATLPPGVSIARSMVIQGAEASGAGVVCHGGEIGRAGAPSTTRNPTVMIQSRRIGETWSRPAGVRFAGCVIHGNVRIRGLGAGRYLDDLRASSRRPGHTTRVQSAAPTDIVLQEVSFASTGSIPLYVGPGVTGVQVIGGRFLGYSVSTAIYLDAESADSLVQAVAFDIRTSREQIAVDGSARNRIVANRFALRGRGGVFLYRNCGEDGVVRHQTPSNNVITDNTFNDASRFLSRAVVVGSREGRRSYCGDDAGYPLGSSLDNGDHATGNDVQRNRVRYSWLPAWLQPR